jgi:phage-related protein
MPESITSALVAQKNALTNLAPWVWLLELDLDGSQAVRIAATDSDVTFGGQAFRAAPITLGPLSRDRQGVLQEVEVVVSNVGGWLSAHLEAGSLLDRTWRIRLVHSAALSDVLFDSTFTVLEATASLESVAFRLAASRLLESPLPAQVFQRGRCRWRYGGAGCNYSTALPNLISGTHPQFDPSTCDLTLDGPNGCRSHGANEAANGVPPQHPAFFGGFPGIPKGPARV